VKAVRCQSQLERITDSVAAGTGFINEAHFLPHAGLALPVWLPEPSPASDKGSGRTSDTDAWRDNQKSWGSLLAEHIWQEVVLAHEYRHNNVEARQNAGCM